MVNKPISFPLKETFLGRGGGRRLFIFLIIHNYNAFVIFMVFIFFMFRTVLRNNAFSTVIVNLSQVFDYKSTLEFYVNKNIQI